MGPRGVVGVKSDWELGSADGGGSSFKSMERCVARRVAGLGADVDSELEDVGDGLGSVLGGSSRRKGGSGLLWATGELSTASRTGSKAGIVAAVERAQKAGKKEDIRRWK